MPLKSKAIGLTLMSILVLSQFPLAQDERPRLLFEQELQRIIAAPDAELEDATDNLLGNLTKLLQVEAAAPMTRRRLLDQWRFRRSDIQIGGGGGAAGTTSSVLDPLLPATFGFALENGSITRTIDGTTATIKVNPAGLFCASGAMSSDSGAALRDTGCLDLWRRTSVSVSFDTSRGDAQETPGLMSLGDQFSEAAVRVELLNQRNPETEGFRAAIARWEQSAQPLADTLVAVDAWLSKTENTSAGQPIPESDRRSKIGKAISDDINEARQINSNSLLGEEQRENLLFQREEQIMQKLTEEAQRLLEEMPSETREKLDQSIPLWLRTLEIDDSNYNRFAHGWVITAEYAFQRPDIATEAIDDIVAAGTRPPSLHTGRLIIAKGLPTRNLDFTLNLSSSWFNETRPGIGGRWRDFQAGGQATIRFRQVRSFGAPALSLAGLWLHLAQPPLGFMVPTFNESPINQPGNVGVFQAKLELPTANAAVRVPISFTYASRTELIQESDVRGQIGITLNLDGLFPN